MQDVLSEIDLSRIDLNLLVLFEVVMAERHVARTAKRLHVSPSAVSHGLARLRHTLQDPLFLKHPKGVVPTERASELAAPIAQILEGVRRVVSSVEGFDPKRSTRRFTIGAPDAVFTVIMPQLLSVLSKSAPQVDLAMRTLLPQHSCLRTAASLRTPPSTSVISGCERSSREARRPRSWFTPTPRQT